MRNNHQADLKWLNEPRTIQVKRLDPKASIKRQLPDTRAVQSLDGLWQVQVSDQPDWSIPPEKIPDNDARWEPIEVPSHLQLAGYGQIQYTNTAYPWDGKEDVKQGTAPQNNLQAIYRHSFDLDPKLERENIQLVFEGVESAFYVWLNGEFVGYSTDSFTPSAFDVTGLVKEKGNELRVAVYQFHAGSWLEDQDFFRFSGIFRPVKLKAFRNIHLDDLKITTTLSDDFEDGLIRVQLFDQGASEFELTLRDPDGEILLRQKTDLRDLELEIEQARLWSAEKPDLYTLEIRLLDEQSLTAEIVTQKIGIRQIEIVDGILRLNGKRLMLHGVNRHEFSPEKGRAIGRKEMVSDIEFCKQNNINAIRTSHYPNQEEFYDLCDEYGIYVMDEVNLETHGTWTSSFDNLEASPLPASLPIWRDALIDRARSMLERDKNHPSILFWSLGNESSSGDNLLEEAAWLRLQDPHRIIHYEGAWNDPDYKECSDVYSRMYAPVEELEQILENHPDRPVILCEYMHAMGNSLGGMYRYIQLERYPHYQGGFIWDLIDQAIEYHKDGQKVLGYGGDFGDQPNSGNFSGDGLLFADRQPSAKVQEVKALYSPIRIVPDKTGVQILNGNLFIDTSSYRFFYEQKMENTPILEGEIDVDLAAGEYAHFPVDWKQTKQESVCTVYALLRDHDKARRAGDMVAFGQTITGKTDYYASVSEPVQMIQGRENIGFKTAGFEALFNDKGLVSLRHQGKEWFQSMPRPVFAHAYTDNELGCRFDLESSYWYGASLFARVRSFSLISDPKGLFHTLSYQYELPYPAPSALRCTLSYTIAAPGTIGVDFSMEPCRMLPDLPVFGVQFELPAHCDRFVFYGNGPMENYTDRMEGARLDVYESDAKSSLQPYLRPQESGNHTGVRWIELFNSDAQCLRFSKLVSPFEASVLPYSFDVLQNASHQEDLPMAEGTFVRIAAEHMGVGGVDSWGSRVDLRHRIHAGNSHRFSFFMTFPQDPFARQEDVAAAVDQGQNSQKEEALFESNDQLSSLAPESEDIPSSSQTEAVDLHGQPENDTAPQVEPEVPAAASTPVEAVDSLPEPEAESGLDVQPKPETEKE